MKLQAQKKKKKKNQYQTFNKTISPKSIINI